MMRSKKNDTVYIYAHVCGLDDWGNDGVEEFLIPLLFRVLDRTFAALTEKTDADTFIDCFLQTQRPDGGVTNLQVRGTKSDS